jgi:ribose transport system permease protein
MAQATAPPSAKSDHSSRRLRLVADIGLRRGGLVVSWLVVIVVFTLIDPSGVFLTHLNFATIFSTQSVLVLLALGAIIPFTTGDYDLSVASNLGLSGMVLAVLNVRAGWPIWAAIAAALLTGLVFGLVNGLIAVLLDIDTLIVTLGSATLAAGITLGISGSNTISGVSDGLSNWVLGHQVAGLSISFFYALGATLAIWYLFSFTAVGRRLLMVGRGRAASRLAGIHVHRIRIGAMATGGLFAAIAGVISTGTSGAADPNSASSLLLPAFAAAFLGATAITPGRFNPWGTFIAAYFLQTGISGLQLRGAQGYVQQLFYGGALIVAVITSRLAQRRSSAGDITGGGG